MLTGSNSGTMTSCWVNNKLITPKIVIYVTRARSSRQTLIEGNGIMLRALSIGIKNQTLCKETNNGIAILI